MTEAMTLPDALALAITHHQAGRLPDAERLYRAILDVEPLHPDANHNIGLLAVQVGQFEEALPYFAKALEADPSQDRFWLSSADVLIQLGQYDLSRAVLTQGQQLGLSGPEVEALTVRLNAATSALVSPPSIIPAKAGRTEEDISMTKNCENNLDHRVNEVFAVATAHHIAGRLADAVTEYKRVLVIDPDQAKTLNLLGLALASMGQENEAETSYRRALQIKPDYADAHNNLGGILLGLRRFKEAEACFRRVLEINPNYVPAHNNLGNALCELNRPEEAVSCFRLALEIGPTDFAETHSNLSTALCHLGRPEEAEASCRLALEVKPDYAEAHNNLGNALRDLGRTKEAEASYRRALEIKPDYAEAHNNLGSALRDLGRAKEAETSYRRALEINPLSFQTQVKLAAMQFSHGDLSAAWVNFEARWNVNKYKPVNRVKFSQPRWRGEPLRGKELLILGEQGVADEISGASMLPDVVSWSERCVVECDNRLVDLFARSFPSLTFTPRQYVPTSRTEGAHFQIPLISLAGLVRNELADFPHTSGYLTPDAAKCARWRRWLDGLGPGLKVGLSWTGRITTARDLRHFPSLERLADIFAIPGLVFVNLQYDGHTEDIETLYKKTGQVIHCPPDVDLTNDLDDVAALTATLDAVVAPLTAISILAGAMGIPAWMYAAYPADGCVILDHGHVPWCPSIRVVKHRFGDEWDETLGRVADSLREFTEARQQACATPERTP